ncbi:MAG: hypothetical protein J6R57_02850 [Bacteroidales bacterium]|nr:hypothetical protein [Bacteroidales bacterium]
MKRNYPLFIIDKTTSEGFPYHHIAVMGETPFVVRVRLVKTLDVISAGAFHLQMLSRGAILFEVVSTKEDGPHIQSLLKKAAKKYMLGYKTDNYKGKDLSLDNQIHQQKLTIEHNKRNYAKLVEQAGGDESLAKFNIALAQATLESLYKLKEIQEL